MNYGNIEVRPTATLTKHRWVLVLEYNFTENVWHWRNITVVKGWVLRWNNETVYLFQAPIVSYGEMKKYTTNSLTRWFLGVNSMG